MRKADSDLKQKQKQNELKQREIAKMSEQNEQMEEEIQQQMAANVRRITHLNRRCGNKY